MVIPVGAGLASPVATGPINAAGPPGWIVTGVLLGVSIIGSVLKKKPGSPPPESQGFALTENPTDPRAPWLMPYGICWFRPPLLQQAISPATLNSKKASREARYTKTYHNGKGPMDGRDFRMKHGGTLLFDVIDATAPVEKRNLTDISNGERREWVFPVGGVDHDSVAIYLDGTLLGTTDAGAETTDDQKTTVTQKSVTPETLNNPWYWNFDDLQIGGVLPVQGVIDKDSVELKIQTRSSKQRITFASGANLKGPWITVPREDIAYQQTEDGEYQFYLLTKSIILPTNLRKFVISYTLVSAPPFVLKVNDAQRTIAVFKDPVASGTLTATYRTTTVTETFAYQFRRGQLEQDPIAFDESEAGNRATYLVGGELTQGTVRRYSTTNAVDEIVAGVDSGPDGFYSSSGGFGPIARHIQIRLKETSAPDATGTGTDLSSGWIDMLDPIKGGATFRLSDFLQGTAHWYFGLASLYHYTKEGSLKANVSYYLPRRAYDIEIVATDPANANNKGTVNADVYHSELVFATATEIRRIGLVVPHQSDVTIQVDQDETIGLDELIEVKAKWREVWVPGANSTYDATSGRPEPGTWQHSRNPVWIACDHIVDEIGGGRIFTWNDIAGDATVWARTLAAAAYAAANNTGRDGTVEVRSYADICLGEDGRRRSLGEHVADILAGSGVLGFWRGFWNFLVDQNDDPVTDPVSGGDFTIDEEADLETADLEMLGVADIPTDIDIRFRDAENDDEWDTETIALDDLDRPDGHPKIVWQRSFPAVRRRSQVQRAGSLLLQQSRRHLRTIVCTATWGRGLRILQLDPGDIVRFTSVRLGLSAALYRVFVVGWSSDMRPGVVLVQHDPAAYGVGFQGPTGAVAPGTRLATDDLPAPSKLTVTRVKTTAGVVFG